ncbi:MAG: Tim44/TimA family putative adaptor protein [Nitratireductor sp.]|nr:Tim44/TimA family putative adaptor protein [Nitratireductor sp.]
MSIFEDLTTLVTLAIAVFIFFRLRSVLGKRTGHQPPPLDPRDAGELPGTRRAPKNARDNIVTLPRKGAKEGAAEEAGRTVSRAEAVVDELAKPGTKLNAGLREIVAADPSFEPGPFLDGAKMAYEMIVTAFADGDRKALRNLLSREVFEGFSAAISERESKGEQVRSSFVGIDSASIVGAELLRNDAQVTVRFVSQIVSSTHAADGTVVDGDPEQVAEVTDVWTFARDVRSKDPNWKLVATEAGS